MHQSWSTLLLASLSATSVLATPITRDDSAPPVAKRDPNAVNIAMAPGASPDCTGKVWSPDEITATIKQATDFKTNNNYQGKDDYPHEFKNRPQTSLNPFKWLFDQPPTFDFPNCPDGPLLEFPLMRDTSNGNTFFQGNNNRPGKNNPDRVIFTYQSDTAATYCGVITHKEDTIVGDEDWDNWYDGELVKSGDFRGCNPLY